jgi:hypothetical protein
MSCPTFHIAKITEKFVWINPRVVTAKEETENEFDRISFGAKQKYVGELRRAAADEFYAKLSPETKRRLEEEISSRHTTKDEKRFCVRFLLLLYEAFISGEIFEQRKLSRANGLRS